MTTISKLFNAPRSCNLLDQPNEILHMIVGFLPTKVFVQFVDDDGIKRHASQYLVLAQVCKRLRRVVLAADFWKEPGFCFSHLLPHHQTELGAGVLDPATPVTPLGVRAGRLMKALLDDEDLLDYVKKKTAWNFEVFEPFLWLAMSCSWFFQSIESVRLVLEGPEIVLALRCLCCCHRLKRLGLRRVGGISNNAGGFDKDLISKSLPHLQQLRLDCFNTRGSLEGLENLSDLSLLDLTGSINLSHDDWRTFLPLPSRWTLRSLTIDGIFTRDAFTEHLNNFFNLTHLTCQWVNNGLIMTLQNLTNIKLHSLRIQFFSDDCNEGLTQLWASDCLRRLKQLHLVFAGSGRPGSHVILQSVAMAGIVQLKILEHFKMEGGFDIAWCPYLASFKRLKCLHLVISEDSIGCTIGQQFYYLEAFPQSEGLLLFWENFTRQDGLIAILEPDFEVVPKMKVSYVQTSLLDIESFPEDFTCLCGGH